MYTYLKIKTYVDRCVVDILENSERYLPYIIAVHKFSVGWYNGIWIKCGQMNVYECFPYFFFVCLFVLEIVRIFSLSGSVSVGIHMFLNRFFQKIFYKWVSLCSLCICCFFFVVFFLFLLMNMFFKKEMQFKYVYDMKIKRFGRY